jgi:hypothetical protein
MMITRMMAATTIAATMALLLLLAVVADVVTTTTTTSSRSIDPPSSSSVSSSWLRQRSLLDPQPVDLPPTLAAIVEQIDPKNRVPLDVLFQASAAVGETTMTRAADACRARTPTPCTTYRFRGRGVNVVNPLLGPDTNWLGKQITGEIMADGGVKLSLLNDYADGSQQSPADLYLSSIKKALKSPVPWVYVFRFPFPGVVELDNDPSLIVDYRARGGLFAPAVDGMRPVTRNGLRQVGFDIDEDLDVSDVWIGFLTFTFLGIFNLYSHYFVVQFNLDDIDLLP